MPKNSSKKPITSFREEVYKITRTIPVGKTLNYKDVARLAGHPRAARAVGNALNKNIDPKTPCHRVIRSDGSVGGFRYGSKQKTHLLKNEGMVVKNRRVVFLKNKYWE